MTTLFKLGGIGRVSLRFLWFDFWMGLFYDQSRRVLYIGVLPCIIVRIEL